MRTGTRTVRAPSLITSAPAMISGRLARTASRTFSSWRSQSRAPREKSSYHLAAPALSPRFSSTGLTSLLVHLFAARRYCRVALFLCEERCDVTERFLGAVLVVTIFCYQPLLDHRDLLAGILIGPRRRSDEPQHVATLLEQVLLDGFAHAGVARKLEFLARLESDH